MTAQKHDRQAKQAFIIDNVDPSNYEDFHEFCNDEAGQIDIDGWSFQYVQELIQKFNNRLEKDARDDEGEHERSFANYQSNSGKDQKKQNPKTQVVLSQQQKCENSEKYEVKQHLEDSIEEKQKLGFESKGASKSDSLQLKQEQKEISAEAKSEYDKSFFNSSNFWDVPNAHNQDFTKQNSFQLKQALNTNTMLKEEISKGPTNQQKPQIIIKAASNQIQSSHKDKDDFSAFISSVDQPKKGKVESIKNEGVKLKQIKQFIPNSASVFSSTLLSPKSKTLKETNKGQKLFKIDFIDTVPCVKSSIRPNLSNQNLKVEIRSFQTVQRSIFASNYLMYNLKVFPSETICKRNYDDFNKFKLALEKFYPGIQLPYLEKDKGTNNEQTQMLEYFMTDVLSNIELRNSRITQEFLSLQDHKKMKRKFEQYAKMSKLKSIEEMCLIDGKVQIALTENERIYNQGMTKLLPKIESNLQKYRKQCEVLSTQYHQAMTTILHIDEIVKQVEKDTQQFNKGVAMKQIEGLEESLKKMRNQFKQNYFRLKFEKTLIEEQILPFFKYEKENIHTSKDILDSSNSLTQKYFKRLQNEGVHIKDSYINESNSAFKLGIREQSKSILVLKYQVGFMQAQASSELHRILEKLGEKIGQKWRQIGSDYLGQLAKSVNIWSSIV